MSLETIEFKGEVYPKWQAEGFAAKFCFPFAEQVCKGVGVDVGANRIEWRFPRSFPVDPNINEWDAYNFPKGEVHPAKYNYVFSSHCIEHLPDWVKALDYWHTRLKVGGVVFLYLPDHSQKYWRSWHNRKHIHNLTPEIVGNYFKDQPVMWGDVLVSNVDLNSSFIVVAYKK